MKVYPRVSLYALMLAAAGIPLYIHVPRFASTELQISLEAIGTLLLIIRLVDLVQDPLIGWAIDRWPRAQGLFALSAAAGLAVGFPALFNLGPGQSVAWQLLATLVLLFTAYSLGSILLYGRSTTLALRPEPDELMVLAGWREGGTLAGVIIASIAPSVFYGLGAGGQGYPAFGLLLGAIAVVTALVTRPIWQRPPLAGEPLSASGLVRSGALRLLVIALVNSLPVAITSTLFLFFVEDRLKLAGWSGPLLVLFFLSAGVSVPFWTKLSGRIGARATLLVAMPLAILGFVGAALLEPGSLIGFAAICAASGVALGADMVILPAMFSVALSKAGLNASVAFGIWSFAGKLGLALAAFMVLPLLARNGFVPGQPNSPEALSSLAFAYALLPCGLKILAIGLVLRLPKEG